jgi:hypothetical protein
MRRTRAVPTNTMKQALNSIIQTIPLNSDPDRDAKMEATTRMISEFVEHNR